MLPRCCLIAVLLLAAAPGHAGELRVAVAANLQPAFIELAQEFGARHGVSLAPSYASSGKFFAQIVAGAPFELFLSADCDYPRRLQALGRLQAPPRVYAFGVLVLWTLRALDLRDWPRALADPTLRHLALPNPRLAPYGRAAQQALARHGLAARLAAKQVLGESVAQASQFVASGAADAGFTAQSLVLGRPGHWVAIDPADHAPIEQCVALLAGASPLAAAFVDALRQPPAQALLERHGYRPATPP